MVYITELHQSNITDENFNEWDLQSRLIEYSSWEEYVQNYIDHVDSINPIVYKGCKGLTYLKNKEITRLEYDDHKMICELKSLKSNWYCKLYACIAEVCEEEYL